MKSLAAGAALLLSMTLAGCSDVEDLAREKASEAACSVARSAMDEASTQAKQAAEKINADPQAARRELTALRDSLKALEGRVDGETGGKITEARKALDRLVEQADAARAGTPVDDQAVADAEAELDTAVESFSSLC